MIIWSGRLGRGSCPRSYLPITGVSPELTSPKDFANPLRASAPLLRSWEKQDIIYKGIYPRDGNVCLPALWVGPVVAEWLPVQGG